MSKVRYYIKSKKNPSTLYVRFSVMRGLLFRKSTQLQINPKFFNEKTGKIRNIDNYTGGSELMATMEKLRGHIIASFNTASTNSTNTNSQWFEGVINTFFNRVGHNNLEYLGIYAIKYIDKLPMKINRNGTIGCTKGTITRYTSMAKKIATFEKARNRQYKITDVGLEFRDDYLKYLLEELNHGENTAARYINFVKTVCLDAKRNKIEVHPQLEFVRGFTKKTDKIILAFNEIELIEKCDFLNKNLAIARDWLVIGCYLGQRLSDLLDVTTENLTVKNGHRLIELTQMKTKKKVSILIHPKVESILKKYNGEFPPRFRESKFSNQHIFNVQIKEVARQAGITEVVYGGKLKSETNRKVWDNYPKWQLVSSHIMRRSFASNFYGNIPTVLLMSVTGHSTEKMFLEYVGKSPIHYIEQLAQYWNR